MDYKTLHGSASQAASSRSIVGSGQTTQASKLHSALPEGAFEIIDEVEGLLVGVAGSAPADLLEPALEALTSGGKRLRPLLLVLSALMGEPRQEDLLGAATAIEVLHTATLIHDDIVDRAESRRGVPTTVAGYGREIAAATGDYLFAEAFSELARIGDPRPLPGCVCGRGNAWRALTRADRRPRQLRPGAWHSLPDIGRHNGPRRQAGPYGQGYWHGPHRGHRDAAGHLRPWRRRHGHDPARPRRPQSNARAARGRHRSCARHGRRGQDRGVGQGRDRRGPRGHRPSA